ncbi:C-X-C motif chemokine 10 [Caretta caretta]|uniref:C-X-C motif chemokine 10 n=1 Tax=Caretta caretta TaxID=8467 RepID=UPI0020952114|nr:C-X-C motif chemokine 10-like [Caretta caretta]
MKGTWAVVLCSVLLLAAEIQGQLTYGHGHCTCKEKGSDFIQRKALGKIEVIPKSSSCDHVEIIATMKPTGEQRCLNPNSKWVQKIITTLTKKKSSQSTHWERRRAKDHFNRHVRFSDFSASGSLSSEQ